jgi:hypothetical protein
VIAWRDRRDERDARDRQNEMEIQSARVALADFFIMLLVKGM